MKSYLFTAFLSMMLLSVPCLIAKESKQNTADYYFSEKGEVYFSFLISSPDELKILTRIISLDNVKENMVYAYANREEFETFLKLNYAYAILPHPGDLLADSCLRPAGSGEGPLSLWNYYPTYQEYIGFMNGFATNNPEICKLVSIGYSIQGRELLAVKISDQVNLNEAEPEFFYTSSIHGDETTGYVTMLHLIDYLLTNYGSDPRITNIVNTTEIFINPLANPDGTYWGGNNSVNGARRYNANNVDLNRNYPDPEDGPHPDGNSWQTETIAFMELADSNNFSMAANFHGGEEVFNYPWDTWAKLAADDTWWQFVGHEYVDTVHVYSPSTYFSGLIMVSPMDMPGIRSPVVVRII